MTRAVAVLAVLPEYRRRFVEKLQELFASRGDDLVLVAGDEHLDGTVRSAEFDGAVRVRNRHIAGRRLLWQKGALKYPRGADVVIVDLNPRSVTAWTLILLAKMRRQRLLVWGHILPRAGANSSTMPLRRFMRRRADGVISYTWSDAHRVLAEDPKAAVWVAANGLYRRSELGVDKYSERRDILYVGRLESAKKPMLAVDAFAEALKDLPKSCRLVFVGSGAQADALRARVNDLGIASSVVFEGQVSEVDALREIYSTARVSVSPGYVGLSLTQSLGFGVPMLVADDEPHSPEVELLTEATGAYFTANSPTDLARQLVSIFQTNDRWDSDALVASVIERYTADAMARGFFDAVHGERPVVTDG